MIISQFKVKIIDFDEFAFIYHLKSSEILSN